MEDTATHFKCFPRSPYHSNKTARNSSPFWFFNLINPSGRKINVISPQEDQVSNELQTVSKEEYERVLQERNSLKDQLLRKNEEINKLKERISRMTGELDHWLLSDPIFAINLRHTQDEAGSSSNNKRQLSVTTAESNVVNTDQNKEKSVQDDKTQPVVRERVERDIIGARASPLPPLPPPVQTRETRQTPPWSTKDSLDSYERIFAKIREEKQLNKEKEAGLEAAGAAPIALAALARLPSDLCYTDIFHTLVARGLITPRSPEADGSGLHNHISYLQICEYHKGSRGHSTENCGQLRLQVGKLIREGVIKVEPPNLVVFQNKSPVPNKPSFIM